MPVEDRPPQTLDEAIQIVLSTWPGKEATSREISDEIDRQNLRLVAVPHLCDLPAPDVTDRKAA